MNTIIAPRSSSPSPPEAPGPDLDARILAAEHAVLVRDQRLRGEFRDFADQLRERSRYFGRIAALAGAGAFALGWLMARRAPRSSSTRPHDQRPREPSLAELPWAGLVPLAWPLLPQALRSRIGPGLASFLTGIGLPLLAKLLARRARPAPSPGSSRSEAARDH